MLSGAGIGLETSGGGLPITGRKVFTLLLFWENMNFISLQRFLYLFLPSDIGTIARDIGTAL